jgi:hypothetical protein
MGQELERVRLEVAALSEQREKLSEERARLSDDKQVRCPRCAVILQMCIYSSMRSGALMSI